MKAAVLHEYKKPLVIEEIPRPVSGPGEVLLEIEACGVCHSDLHLADAKAAYDLAFYGLRPTGTLLVVGLHAEDISFPPVMMAAGEVHIQATAVGTRDDLREILAMAATGKVHCHANSRPLAQVNEVLQELRRGRIAGRVVLTPH